MKQEASTTITWGEAIAEIKKGKYVRRMGWNGKGMFLFLFSQSDFLSQGDDWEDHLMDDETGRIDHLGFNLDGYFYPIADFILLKTARGLCIPWNASQEDQLAHDWEVIEYVQQTPVSTE